jgi:hypothetical protein
MSRDVHICRTFTLEPLGLDLRANVAGELRANHPNVRVTLAARSNNDSPQ